LCCVTEQENSARNRLIGGLVPQMDGAAFEQPMLSWLCIAWMHCSYATIPQRTLGKKTLNRMLVAWMEAIGLKQQPLLTAEKKTAKPVLLIVNEYFQTGHAMYRCYAPTIDALRAHFYLVGLTPKRNCDENSIKLFDEHHYIEWSDYADASIKGTVDSIRKINPHAIYYPSIGMGITSILLANLRLAPCQFMSLGHPASSHSDVIDYCLLEDQFLADRSQFSEKLFALEENA